MAARPVSRVALAAVLSLAAGCTSSPAGRQSAQSPGAPTPTPQIAQSPEPVHPVSLQALFQKQYDGRDLRVGRVLSRASSYARYAVTYESGNLTISGIMNVPAGTGPFPVLILNHGYIDPDIYTTGRGLAREQDYLARAGYVVIHTDYRNHAGSDDDPNFEFNLRLGYTEDVINAVLAVKGSKLPYLDGNRVGLLGRSMGGGVTLNAALVRPDLVKAIVLYASVSSNVVDNFNKWIRGSDERRSLAQRIMDRFGSPEANPTFWRNLSPVNFLDRLAVPVILHHGTNDESCPIAWSHATLAALQSQGKDAQLLVYEGEQHAFGPQWGLSIRRTVSFLDQHVKAA